MCCGWPPARFIDGVLGSCYMQTSGPANPVPFASVSDVLCIQCVTCRTDPALGGAASGTGATCSWGRDFGDNCVCLDKGRSSSLLLRMQTSEVGF